MDVTKLSTKGQVVIPERMRKGYEPGSSFVITKVNELIVLKPIKGFSEKELKELRKIWKEIDEGKAGSYSEKEFFKNLKKW